MIPTQVTALGFIQLMRKMHLMNSFIPLIIPAIAAPAVFFYMKQYMESTLPLELLEAARIDGAGEFRTFNQIALPLMKPAIAVQAIFSFVGSWNNYFTPALILTDDNKKTLPILIATLRSADYLKFDMGQVYMMITFSILPVIIVYLILSKNIVSGLAVGAVKGAVGTVTNAISGVKRLFIYDAPYCFNVDKMELFFLLKTFPRSYAVLAVPIRSPTFIYVMVFVVIYF